LKSLKDKVGAIAKQLRSPVTCLEIRDQFGEFIEDAEDQLNSIYIQLENVKVSQVCIVVGKVDERRRFFMLVVKAMGSHSSKLIQSFANVTALWFF